MLLLAPAGLNAQGALPSGPGFVAASASVFEATLPETNARTQDISTEELKGALSDGTILVLDTRPYREFALSHIPGAKNVAPLFLRM